MIKFTVLGKPVAQGRVRTTTINGKPRCYDPKKSSDYKDYVRLAATPHAPKSLLEGPLCMKLKIYKPTLKSFNKTEKEQAELGLLRPTTKPDIDNYVKGVADALNNVIWKDDNQLVDVFASKFYSEKPRIEIEIEEL
ncbi:RusA family crossover junction endodeoxyribonuclease [Chengkuizengella marina]|uniref:RusA family crossover junction endodeoxyribonuclease n=1 Tax=Chengkuizengella marina TaxID=2507566 RepID=A0A6N9Q8J2_9BACL|nr:RusA family crossover junction endodeoxyribonuclease [Chengkuizengella marina]NBI31172.1 RusA family crossover junction endodeoxyribonuclease [Chengkuizengella marina]